MILEDELAEPNFGAANFLSSGQKQSVCEMRLGILNFPHTSKKVKKPFGCDDSAFGDGKQKPDSIRCPVPASFFN